MEAPPEESVPPQDSGDLSSSRAVRILVQTSTHLVPGNDYGERIGKMRNIICQHHWNRDFDWHKERSDVYGNDFGFENRNCYFLLDHGHEYWTSPEPPPVLWYKWTGDSLIPMQQPLPEKIKSKLSKRPFTKQGVKRGIGKPSQWDPTTHRKVIRSKLHCDMAITDVNIQFLASHPEDAIWLQNNVEPRFWSKIQSLLESSHDNGTLLRSGGHVGETVHSGGVGPPQDGGILPQVLHRSHERASEPDSVSDEYLQRGRNPTQPRHLLPLTLITPNRRVIHDAGV